MRERNKITYVILTYLAANQLVQAAPTKSVSTVNSQISGEYARLLKPLDIYAPPPGAKKLLSLSELYNLVKTQGVSLKVAGEDLNSAKQSASSYKDRVLPTLSVSAGANEDWSTTRSDSDTSDGYVDRDGTTQSRKVSGNTTLSLTGAPLEGTKYSLKYPQYAVTKIDPDESTQSPRREHSSNFIAQFEVNLLQGSPFLTDKLVNQRQRLEMVKAKTVYRQSALQAIANAEKAYFELIQKYQQLTTLQRAFELAKALENDVREKISAGESSQLESMRVSLLTSQSEAEVATSQIEYEEAIEAFRNNLSYDGVQGAGIFPDPKSIEVDFSKIKLPTAAETDELKKSNPDVILAKISKRDADMSLELARKNLLPSLAFTTNFNNGAPSETWGRTWIDPAMPNDRVFSLGLTYTQILYNNINSHAKQQAVVAKARAELAIDQVEKSAVKTFNSLLKRLDIGQRRLKIAMISRQLAEQKLKAEYEKFQEGESSVRNVIDSQSEINSARVAEIAARINVLIGMSELRTINGRLPEGVSILNADLNAWKD